MSTEIIYRGEQDLEVAGTLMTVEFEVTADVTYRPARISGPPESCSPDESELDVTEQHIVSIKDAEGNEVPFMPEAAGRLLAALDWDSIENKIWEEFHTQQTAGEEPEPEEDDDIIPWLPED